MTKLDLAVIMPVYNEEESVARVIHEWIPVLDKTVNSYRILALDDGSKDGTLNLLRALAERYPGKIEVHTHANRGHGQTCVVGYQKAAAAQVPWVLQIDSDGQCDPRYFPDFWRARERHPLIFGYRHRRDDGYSRFLISRLVALSAWLACGVWVKDPNVPYRLMRGSLVAQCLPRVPADFYLANILFSLLLRKAAPIHWIPIRFRDRFGGSPSLKFRSFAQHGMRLFLHLVRIRTKI